MRIELAKLLLRRPDVLLLDEPTNHLDIESIQCLENFLSTRANAVVLGMVMATEGASCSAVVSGTAKDTPVSYTHLGKRSIPVICPGTWPANTIV